MAEVNGFAVHYVDTPAALDAAAARWSGQPLLAVDTEFMRVRTFHAQAALFQVCDGNACYLIDPLAIEDLGPLARVLADRATQKIMHSCSEDLEVCERRLGVLPEPLIDTQIAAAFCGHVLSVGYQKVLEAELGVRLEKSATRTDWLQRPLTASQLHYAAEDVAWLPALWTALSARLDASEAGQWAREECAAVLERFRARDSANGYRSIGGAWRLDPAQLAVLRALYDWRERLARDKDLPRNWIVPDAVLLELARTRPESAGALEGIADLPQGSRRRYAGMILEVIRQAGDCGEAPAPLPAPPDAAAGRMVKGLRAHVLSRGTALGIAPEMLARRRDLEELARWRAGAIDGEELGVMRGWRRGVIGEELLRLAGGWVA